MSQAGEGMPLEFMAIDLERNVPVKSSMPSHRSLRQLKSPAEAAADVFEQSIPVIPTKEGFRLKSKFLLCQAIGAFDNSSPPQKLRIGDVIEFYYPYQNNRFIGVIVYFEFQILIEFYRPDLKIKLLYPFYLSTSYPIIRLGSSHDPGMKKVMEKAGLAKDFDKQMDEAMKVTNEDLEREFEI